MIRIITANNSGSSRRALRWLQAENIAYTELNMTKETLSIAELKAILRVSENGIDDILATHSKLYPALKTRYQDMSLNAVLREVQKHPTLLRSPLIYDDRRLVVGFNQERARMLIPRAQRKTALWTALAAFQDFPN